MQDNGDALFRAGEWMNISLFAWKGAFRFPYVFYCVIKRRLSIRKLSKEEAQGGDTVAFCDTFAYIHAVAKCKRNIAVCGVHYYNGNASVRIMESCSFQFLRKTGKSDADSSRFDKAAEVADIVVGQKLCILLFVSVTHDNSFAEIIDMVGAAVLIKDQTPVDERVCSMIQVADDIMGIHPGVGQVVIFAEFTVFYATF